jgi:hypothetical protein
MSYRSSTKDKIVDYFFNNTYNTLTVAQAQARFGVKNIRARVHELRNEGFAIYTNKKTLSDGRQITFYRLGRPTSRYTRNVEAGRSVLARKSLYTRAA